MFTANIYIKGIIKDIQFSHTCNDKQYNKALIEIDESNIIPIKFRQDMLYVNNLLEDDFVSTQGTLRTYSKQIYIHTNLAHAEVTDELNCLCTVLGKVVKSDERYNAYIIQCDNDTFIPIKSDNIYSIGDEINVSGYLVERRYTKKGNPIEFITYEVII